jgi:hypothetical protein
MNKTLIVPAASTDPTYLFNSAWMSVPYCCRILSKYIDSKVLSNYRLLYNAIAGKYYTPMVLAWQVRAHEVQIP